MAVSSKWWITKFERRKDDENGIDYLRIWVSAGNGASTVYVIDPVGTTFDGMDVSAIAHYVESLGTADFTQGLWMQPGSYDIDNAVAS